MSDITLEALRLRERELEIDAVLIRGRILEVRANIEELQRRRGGRPRKGVVEVVNGPDGVPGAAWHTPTDDPEAAE